MRRHQIIWFEQNVFLSFISFLLRFSLPFWLLVDATQSVAPVSLSNFLPFWDCASRAEAYGINEWANEWMFAFTICHGSFSLWLFVYYISLAFCKCKAAWVFRCFFFLLSFFFLSHFFFVLFLLVFNSLSLFGALSDFPFKIECWMAEC